MGLTEYLERLALDPELHSLWSRAIESPESLDDAERDRFDRLVVGLLVRCLDAHRHGELDAKIAERFDHLARHYLCLTSVQAWWGSASDFLHSMNPELAAYIDHQLKIAERGDSPAA